MAVINIVRAEFQRLVPSHHVLDGFIGAEIEWFADDTRAILGVIALGKSARAWNWVAFKRQAGGDYRACKLIWDVDDWDVARVQLLQAMEACGNGKGE